MKKLKKIFIILCVVISFTSLSALLYVSYVVNPILVRLAEAKVSNLVTIAVNKAIFSVLSEDIDYNDLVNIHKNQSGEILLLQANTLKINLIAKNTAKQSQAELDKIKKTILNLPVGSLTGSPLLIGFGPEIDVNMLTFGSVICSFKSEFESAGINQTKHKIYIEVNAESELILPISTKKITSKVEVFISEAILVGDVPQIYLQNLGNKQYSSNFVP